MQIVQQNDTKMCRVSIVESNDTFYNEVRLKKIVPRKEPVFPWGYFVIYRIKLYKNFFRREGIIMRKFKEINPSPSAALGAGFAAGAGADG